MAVAARALGVTIDAVAAERRRGSLHGQRDDHGRWPVHLPEAVATEPTVGRDRSMPGYDRSTTDAIMAAIRAHIDDLRAELAWRDDDLAHERARGQELHEALSEERRRRDELVGELRDPLHHQQEWREAEERHQAELQATVDRHEAALAELANRIVGLVEAGRRPWWRRLIGRGLRDVL